MERNLIYKATVKFDDNQTREYIGSTGNQFKTRYNAHQNSFKKESKIAETKLSAFIWELKKKKTDYTLKWTIVHKLRSSRTARGCALCNLERYEIAKADKRITLNKRSELQSKCPHEKGSYFPPLPKPR